MCSSNCKDILEPCLAISYALLNLLCIESNLENCCEFEEMIGADMQHHYGLGLSAYSPVHFGISLRMQLG